MPKGTAIASKSFFFRSKKRISELGFRDGYIYGRTNTNKYSYYGRNRRCFLAIVAGQSGCGKTTLVNNLLTQMMLTYGAAAQYVVIDPKRVGFLDFMKRAHVYTDENDWPRLLQSLENEMMRRYEFMFKSSITDYPISSETPFILLVIDELNAVTNNQNLTKKERDEIVSKLISLSNQMRQASMGMLLIMQSADTTVIPSTVRANCSTRFAMKTSSEAMVKMITGDRESDAPANLLYMTGEFFALTNLTNQRFVRGRTWTTSFDKTQEIMRKVNPDKRNLYCLDWQNPDFLG